MGLTDFAAFEASPTQLDEYPIDKITDPKKEKENYGADIVFKSGNEYYICNQIIEADFEDIK